jgi:hypothetical protein
VDFEVVVADGTTGWAVRREADPGDGSEGRWTERFICGCGCGLPERAHPPSEVSRFGNELNTEPGAGGDARARRKLALRDAGTQPTLRIDDDFELDIVAAGVQAQRPYGGSRRIEVHVDGDSLELLDPDLGAGRNVVIAAGGEPSAAVEGGWKRGHLD